MPGPWVRLPKHPEMGMSLDLRALLRRMRWMDRRYLRCVICKKAQRRIDTSHLLGDGDCICRLCECDSIRRSS